MKQVHVAWTSFQRRQLSIAALMPLEVFFLPIKATARLGKAWAYLSLFFQTLALLRKRRPDVVWVQLPQVPALWSALTYRQLFFPEAKIVADCHNAMFRPPWSRFPLASRSLRAADIILVHNDTQLEAARPIAGTDKVLVLEDAPAPEVPSRELADNPSAPRILFPGSFAADEPIEELIEAARQAPDLSFVITGRLERARARVDLDSLPPNVRLPGFLPLDEFETLLRDCDVVLGLTRHDGIQLSVCNEAIGFGKPMVLSDTPLLRRLFGEAALCVDSTQPASIVTGCRAALQSLEQLSKASRSLAAKRRNEWLRHQANPLLGHLRCK